MRLPFLVLLVAGPLLVAWLPQLEAEPSLAAALAGRSELPERLQPYLAKLEPLAPLMERGPGLLVVLAVAGLAALPWAAVHRRAPPAPQPAAEPGWEPWF